MKVLPAALLWLVVAAAAALSAQSSPSSAAQASPSARATLSGVVTKDPGSEPVKKALIELIAESQSTGGNHTAVTGPDGSFRIENIAPGRYRMFAARTGFQEIDQRHHRTEGRTLTLTAGQEMKDVVIHLQAAAVIEGRVTDEEQGRSRYARTRAVGVDRRGARRPERGHSLVGRVVDEARFDDPVEAVDDLRRRLAHFIHDCRRRDLRRPQAGSRLAKAR